MRVRLGIDVMLRKLLILMTLCFFNVDSCVRVICLPRLVINHCSGCKLSILFTKDWLTRTLIEEAQTAGYQNMITGLILCWLQRWCIQNTIIVSSVITLRIMHCSI